MRNSILLLLLVTFTACQTAKIKNNTYKVSCTNVEFCAIGQSKSLFNLQNDFDAKALAKLENKVRVSIEILPFNKTLNKIYSTKAKYNQNQTKITYTDSMPNKPELAVIRFFDVAGLIKELNGEQNKELISLLRETKKAKIISSIAVALSKEDMAKIRQCDTYYITNNQEKRYAVILYKQGKKTDTIDLNSGTVISYRLSTFCWAANDRGNWYVADIMEGSNNCKGNTKAKIREREKSKNLYKM